MSRRSVMRPGDFLALVDQMFETAKELMAKDGVLIHVLALLDCHGREKLVVNDSDEPFSQQTQRIQAIIRRHRACAGVSIAGARLAWLTLSGDPQVDGLRPVDRPDREEVVAVSGTWPVMGITHTRVATVLRPSEGVVDVVDLDIAGAERAAGLPADGLLSSSSWLSPLLPEY